METQIIDNKEFWKIITDSSQGLENPWEICERIIKNLSVYPLDEIINYECIFRHKLKKAYHWNVIAAANIIEFSGGSTDGFLYFRCWLILMGEEAFEAAIRNPNELTEFINFKKHKITSAENLLYVANYAYGLALGYDGDDEVWEEIHGKIKFKCPGIHYDDIEHQEIRGKEIDWDDYDKFFPELIDVCKNRR